MYHGTCRLSLSSGINTGRLRLASQFASMTGWQSGENNNFDNYIYNRRRRDNFEAFDQRVARGFAAAAKLHKIEIQNAFKRRLKTTGAKCTAANLRELKISIEERIHWLKEVWAQIDADYRSGDASRQEMAAREISLAIKGEPSEYIQWMYETKRELRRAGPIGKRVLESELQHAELPEVSDEEANRYHELQLNMMEIEEQVKRKYGVAGQQHWAELQAAKDEEYIKKIDDAAEVYKQLLDQNARLEESRRTELQRSHVERVHQAQVRFKAAMELEAEREKLIEAHHAMNEERIKLEKEQRRMLLQEAAELRAQGKESAEILTIMKERQIEANAKKQAEYGLKEREEVLQRKTQLLDMIAQFKHDVEEREGKELLLSQQERKYPTERPVNAFGFYDDDAVEDDKLSLWNQSSNINTSHNNKDDASLKPSTSSSSFLHSKTTTNNTMSLSQNQKKELWKAINTDKYEDPFYTVHQARLDAMKTYDPAYARTFPTNLVLGRKYSRQGPGDMAAGNETDRQILQKGNAIAMSFQWGITPKTVHDLDDDGSKDYFMDGNFHVQDKSTGDIDWRYEKKKGGAIFKGPKFYRLGAKREATDPGEQSMDPAPYASPPREHMWRSS